MMLRLWAIRAQCAVQGTSVKTAVLVTPLFFGVAHLHHLYELLAVQQLSPQVALAQVIQALHLLLFT